MEREKMIAEIVEILNNLTARELRIVMAYVLGIKH